MSLLENTAGLPVLQPKIFKNSGTYFIA